MAFRLNLFWLVPALLIISLVLNGQEQIKIMHYNLMNYDFHPDYCTEADNDENDKAQYIHSIVEHVSPDILTVNEMNDDYASVLHLLGNGLNTGGTNRFSAANYTADGQSSIINMLYYDKTKYSIVNQLSIQADVRNFNLYHLEYLNNSEEEIFINVAVCHLKAGNDQSDAYSRGEMTEDFMSFMQNQSSEYTQNLILCGDLNVYNNTETAFENLTEWAYAPIRLIDPADAVGDWHTNYLYSDQHTQSSHATIVPCFSYGGLDDRFDFILVNQDIIYGNHGVKYIEDSYTTLGQDGAHYNDGLLDGGNSSAPANILEALYENSDHLPVIASFEFDNGNTIPSSHSMGKLVVSYPNPFNEHSNIKITQAYPQELGLEIINVFGAKVSSHTIPAQSRYQFKLSLPAHGMYFMRFSNGIRCKTYKLAY